MDHYRPSLDWTEVSPGIWQRDIDEVETFWAKAAKVYDTQGRRPFAITGHVSLKIDIPTAASQTDINATLRKSWCAIRREHPSIASWTDYDFNAERFTRSYHTAETESEREAWLDDTFVEISDGRSGVDFANSDPPAPDVPTIFVITPYSPDDTFEYRDIVLRAPHETLSLIHI